MVTAALASAPRPARGLRPLAVGAIALVLVAAVLGGLQRAGIAPLAEWTASAALGHGMLMIGGWLGTVIALERAVALKTRTAAAAPWLSGASGLALAAGFELAGALLSTLAALAFTASGVQLLQRQRAVHNAVMLTAGVCWCAAGLGWCASGLGWFAGTARDAVFAAAFAFLVLTIAAERLEMTRLLRRHPAAQPAFIAIVAVVVAAVAVGFAAPRAGTLLFGAGLAALALWGATQDIARITVRQKGLPRYMATALWLGYFWLGFGGVAWIGVAFGCPGRDAGLHALGLGFVVSMVMAHAPVILPALARVKLRFGPWFYVPLVALHASLAWRLGASLPQGALLNAAALALFAATVAASRRT